MKVVLGGGIAGLAAGYYLRQKFPGEVIKIFEANGKTGGWIKSTKLPNGVIFEQGPRTLRPKGEAGYNTLALIENLGLSSKVKSISKSHPAAKNRLIYVNGKLHMLPSSFIEIFKKLSPFSKPLISFILRDLVAERKIVLDESIYSFIERRFGTEVAQYAISPLICGICAGDAKEISVKFLLKSTFEKEQKYGGILKGYLYDILKNGLPKPVKFSTTLAEIAKNENWSVYSFEEGMETLPNTLIEKLIQHDVNIELYNNCEKLVFKDDRVYITSTGLYLTQEAKHVTSSLPAKKLADLVQNQHPILATNLRKIPTVNVAVINLHFKAPFPSAEAFGFLVPPSEKLPILGVIFDSCCFPNKSGTVLTVMMGGHCFLKQFGDKPKKEHLLEIALQHVKKILNMYETPDNYKVTILRDCIPQYIVGHSEIVKSIEDYIFSKKLCLSICGSSYYGVGVNDVIFSAKNAVNKL